MQTIRIRSTQPGPTDPNNDIDQERNKYHIPIGGVRRNNHICCVCGNGTRKSITPKSKLHLWLHHKIFLTGFHRVCSPNDNVANHYEDDGTFNQVAIDGLERKKETVLASDEEVMALLENVTEHANIHTPSTVDHLILKRVVKHFVNYRYPNSKTCSHTLTHICETPVTEVNEKHWDYSTPNSVTTCHSISLLTCSL
jgi:hypothetical protein